MTQPWKGSTEADGYAYLGTWSVRLTDKIALPVLDENGDRPENAQEIAWYIQDVLNQALREQLAEES